MANLPPYHYQVPVYPTVGFGGWSCADWVQWHKNLRKITQNHDPSRKLN